MSDGKILSHRLIVWLICIISDDTVLSKSIGFNIDVHTRRGLNKLSLKLDWCLLNVVVSSHLPVKVLFQV